MNSILNLIINKAMNNDGFDTADSIIYIKNKYNTMDSEDTNMNISSIIDDLPDDFDCDLETMWEMHKKYIIGKNSHKHRKQMGKEKSKHGRPKYYSKDYKGKLYRSGDKYNYKNKNWMKMELSSI